MEKATQPEKDSRTGKGDVSDLKGKSTLPSRPDSPPASNLFTRTLDSLPDILSPEDDKEEAEVLSQDRGADTTHMGLPRPRGTDRTTAILNVPSRPNAPILDITTEVGRDVRSMETSRGETEFYDALSEQPVLLLQQYLYLWKRRRPHPSTLESATGTLAGTGA